MVAFAWLYTSMPSQGLSMRAHSSDVSRNLPPRERSVADEHVEQMLTLALLQKQRLLIYRCPVYVHLMGLAIVRL
jgi:hypothetical protein